MKKNLLFFIFMIIVTGITAQSTSWMEGYWTGEGYQPNLGRNPYWTMTLTISLESGEQITKIDYPSVSCGGNWKLISNETNSAVFIEILTYGKDICLDAGKVVLSYIDKDRIKALFYYPQDSKEVYATAFLNRK